MDFLDQIQFFIDSFYLVNLIFSDDYPFKPPKVQFTKKGFHSIVYSNGEVCLDVLANKWKPSMIVMNILVVLRQLLSKPNVISPANGDAAALSMKRKIMTLMFVEIFKSIIVNCLEWNNKCYNK